MRLGVWLWVAVGLGMGLGMGMGMSVWMEMLSGMKLRREGGDVAGDGDRDGIGGGVGD